MNTDTIIYLIRVSISILIFYVLYRALLRERTFFQLNRAYLIIILFISFLIPLVSITWDSLPENNQQYIPSYIAPIQETSLTVQQYISHPLHKESPVKSRSFGDVLFLIYCLITLFFLVRFFLRILQLSKIINASKISNYRETPTLIHPEMPVSTFLSYLFWKEEGSEGDHMIYEHEQVHIRQWHSLDIILLEFISAILWFNPIVTLIKHEIQLLHEYIADAYVLDQVADKSTYTKLLYSQASLPTLPYSQTFSSFISDRVRMIMRKRSSNLSSAIYLSMFPVALVLMSFLSTSKESESYPTTSDTNLYLGSQNEVELDERRNRIENEVIQPNVLQSTGSNKAYIRANLELYTRQLIEMVSDGTIEVEGDNHETIDAQIQHVRMVNLTAATDFHWNEKNPPEPFDPDQFVKDLNENQANEIVHLFIGTDKMSGQVEVHLLDEHLQSFYLKFENSRYVAAPYLAAHGNYTRPSNYVRPKDLGHLLSKPTIPIIVYGEQQILRNIKIVNTLNYGKELNKSEVIKRLQRGKLDHPLSLIGNASHGISYIVNFVDSKGTVKIRQNLRFEWGEMQYSNIDSKILPTTRAWRISIPAIKEMFESEPLLHVNGLTVDNYVLTIGYLDHFGNHTNSELHIKKGKIQSGRAELAVIEQLLTPSEYLSSINITVDGQTTRTHKRVVIMD